MKTTLNLITAAAFLAHMVVGCCWHHPHGTDAHACQAAATQLSATDCGSHDHQHADYPAGDHEGEVPQDACDGETCVATSNIQLNFDLDVSLLSASVATPNVVMAANILSPYSANSSQLEIDTGPQLRPHLAHQILLI